MPGLGRRRRRRPPARRRPAGSRAARRCVSSQPDADATWFPNHTLPAVARHGSRLPLLRDLVANGQIVHDETTFQVDDALAVAHVKETATGLILVNRGPTHLVRALVWAVNAAHRPAPVPAIY